MIKAPAQHIKPNLADAKTLTSYCHYLMMKGQLLGNFRFDGHKPTKEEESVAEQCRKVCDRIARTLDNCPKNDIPELLNYYDIACRVGYRSLPDQAFIKKYQRRVFNAWKAGDRSIEESTIYGMIMQEVAYHPHTANREYIAAYRLLKDRWIATLRRYGRFTDATTYENYQRLAIMMRENIDAEFGVNSERIKRMWYERNKIEDYAGVSSTILCAYRCFATTLYPTVLDYESQIDLDNNLLTELMARRDLDSYTRKAYSLALDYNNHLVED